MAVDDELAWEPRLPWTHPKTLRWRLRAHPSMQPVPERFEIVVPDLLATLTFDSVLGPNPRTRYFARRPMATETIFDPVSHLTPVVWEPVLPTGARRTRRELRRKLNQSSVEPAPQGVIAAQRLTWMPSLPTRTRRLPLRRTGTGNYFELEFSVLAAGFLCTELIHQALTGPVLTVPALSLGPAFISATLTGTAFTREDLC